LRRHTRVWIELEGGGVEVDFAWPTERLIVEVDGFETHGTPTAFERDRDRDVRLRLADWHPARVTWRQVEHGPAGVGRRVVGLLRRLGWRG
jgi:very-short-patch-repair endonuclease